MPESKTDITKESLLADGWVELSFPIIMEKKIENINPLNDIPEDTDIKLILHRLFNTSMFGVMFPDGGILNFVANSMRELKDFENRITFYDCPY